MKKVLIAALVACSITHSALATVGYDQTITFINGSGNPNTGWAANNNNGILLGLRADARLGGPLPGGTTPDNNNGIYVFSPGNITPASPARADWNYQFTINSNPTGAAGGNNLNADDYYLAITVNGVVLGTPIDVLQGFADSSYGNNGTVQGTATTGDKPYDATDIALRANNNVAANSETISFAPFSDPNNSGGIYDFDFYAVAAGAGATGTKLDDVSIEVQVVPEPTTIMAGALMLLPFGMGAVRFLRKQRAA